MAFVCRCTKHLNPPGLASLFVQFACLPDERHITGLRCGGTEIVDLDRVCAARLDVHRVAGVDPHDETSRSSTADSPPNPPSPTHAPPTPSPPPPPHPHQPH